MDSNFEQLDKYWGSKPDKEVQKEINRMDKYLQRTLKAGIGEMGWNGHRSTRKATANFAVARIFDTKYELEKYLQQRKKLRPEII